MLSLLKTVGGPGSLGFLLACVAIGLVAGFVWPRNRRFARIWLASVFVGYAILGLPVVAGLLESRLPEVPSAVATPDGEIDLIIVLDGDNRSERALRTGSIWQRHPSAAVWILGGEELVDATLGTGLPRDKLNVSGQETTTRAQIGRVRRLVAELPQKRVALVASRVQMPRVAALVRAAGLSVNLIASPSDFEPPAGGFGSWLPALGAITLSRDVIYEHAALAYYRWRGWI